MYIRLVTPGSSGLIGIRQGTSAILFCVHCIYIYIVVQLVLANTSAVPAGIYLYTWGGTYIYIYTDPSHIYVYIYIYSSCSLLSSARFPLALLQHVLQQGGTSDSMHHAARLFTSLVIYVYIHLPGETQDTTTCPTPPHYIRHPWVVTDRHSRPRV
jgi:hypothetical protein